MHENSGSFGERIPNPMAQQQHAPFPAMQQHGIPGVPPQPAPQPARRRKTPLALVVAASLVGGTVLGGGAGAGVATLLTAQSAVSPSVSVQGAAAIDPQTIADVASAAGPSVVTIQATSGSGSGTGSGVVVGSGGVIVTNNHVVTLDGKAADATIRVQTSDGRLLDATIVGTDPTVDLAVLRVDADLPAIAIASSKPAAGDTAIAIGAPLGLANTVTDGIVSAVDRGLRIASSATGQEGSDSQQSPFGFWNQQGPQAAPQEISIPVLQTDAAINPGNSGGALLNSAGQLIGVNVAIASMSQSSSTGGSIGIGFAIEASLVKRVVNEIVANGAATHGLLGASVGDVTDASAGVVGATIREVTPGGSAASAGLQAGDVVTAVDGVTVTSATDLTAQIRSFAAGAQVTIAYVRAGTKGQATATLGTLA